MRPRPLPSITVPVGRAVLLAIASLAFALPAHAQDGAPGIVTVSVRDSSSGHAIVNAEVTVEGTTIRGYTDEKGQLRFNAVRMGGTVLAIRRLGYRPLQVDVNVDPRVPAVAQVALSPIVQTLQPVLVKGSTRDLTGRLAGFYQRRELGNGYFISRDKIERENPAQFTDMMRRVPSVQITSTRTIRNAVRFRGASRNCWPLVWLDGAPLPTAEFDLDALAPGSIEGVEIYPGVATIPPQFMGMRGMGSCGVVVIWSREGERRPKKAKKQITAAELNALVNSLKVFTVEQVDQAARPDESQGAVIPIYPDELFEQGITGATLVEFVVDSLGQIELNTFGVITSSHALFTQSVRRSLDDLAFHPALVKGQRVRQLVQWPVRFDLDSATLRRKQRR